MLVRFLILLGGTRVPSYDACLPYVRQAMYGLTAASVFGSVTFWYGSIPLTFGIFSSAADKMPTKKVYFLKFLAYNFITF